MKRLAVVATVVGLIVVFGSFGWDFYVTRGDWAGGSQAIAIATVAGVFAIGALTGPLAWLAFYSARKGHDDLPRLEEPDAAEFKIDTGGHE